MAITSGFFMSVNGDRKYNASFFARYFATFIGNGIFPNPSSNLQVIANDDMTVTVMPGDAWIDGYVMFNDDDYILNITPADGVLNRIDRIVLRWDMYDRKIKPVVKQGDFATNAVAPELQRDADAYELGIADIAVNRGAISITQANITDLRLNKELCGIVHGVVDQVDTTTIFNQYQAWFKEITKGTEQELADWQMATEQEFMDWFDSIKDILEGDVAANLASRISALEKDFGTHLTEFENFKNDTNTTIEKIEKQLSNYNSYSSVKDDNGIFTVVEYKRADGSLYMKSTLSNPDADGNYETMTWEMYDEVGTSVVDTIVWNIEYDEDGDIVSKEVMI